MKYFLDTEFLEGTQRIRQWGLKTDTWLRIAGIGFIVLGIYTFLLVHTYYSLWFLIPALIMFGVSLPKTPETIDLISIGIVAEDGREYYAVSKDFNLREAWFRYDLEYYDPQGNLYSKPKKVYWIRENVIRPLFKELNTKGRTDAEYIKAHLYSVGSEMNYYAVKELIKWYGKTREQIAFDIAKFTLDPTGEGYDKWLGTTDEYYKALKKDSKESPKFYAYYADYDWVAFCWLFGKMIELPKRFPKYCYDLKQMFADIVEAREEEHQLPKDNWFDWESHIKGLPEYPVNEGEHSAIEDARWNVKLFNFLKSIK